MRLVIATGAPERFSHWQQSLVGQGVELVTAAPERRTLGPLLQDERIEAVFLDVAAGADPREFRRMVANLCLARPLGVVGVADRDGLSTLPLGEFDDILQGSAEPEEVLYRARSAAQRARSRPAEITVGELTVRPSEGLTFLGGQRLSLPHREFELLSFLAAHVDRVFPRSELARLVWGMEQPQSLRTVDLHICRLRTRLGEFGRGHLQTVYGVGYVLLP